MNNPYRTLGVSRQSSQEEIREAYRALARIHHPDKPTGISDRFAEITAAHSLLTNPKKLSAFIAALTVTQSPCTACRGAGAKFKQRGLTAREATTCTACDGIGLVTKAGDKNNKLKGIEE